MPQCLNCKTENYVLDPSNGLCSNCLHMLAEEEDYDDSAMHEIIVTTETAHNLPVDQRLDIVGAEYVIGVHMFKDVAIAMRDTFGGRSITMQNGLRNARVIALTELRRTALALGADAVIGVQLHYNEISGGGKSMLLLAATGTAVTLKHLE